MSVFAYVACDYRLCPAQAIGYNMARARQIAREQGWQLGAGKTRFSRGKDYCPQHKDALELATKRGPARSEENSNGLEGDPHHRGA